MTLDVLKDLDQPPNRRVTAAATLGIHPQALHLGTDHRLSTGDQGRSTAVRGLGYRRHHPANEIEDLT